MEITELEQLLPDMIGKDTYDGVIYGDFGQLQIEKEDNELWCAVYRDNEHYKRIYVLNNIQLFAKGKTIQEALEKLYKKMKKNNLL